MARLARSLPKKRRRKRSRANDCEGYIIVTFALVLILLLAFGALAVDIGMMYSARAAAQRAVDSAALAGAFTFVVNPSAAQPETAQQHATDIATSNFIMDTQITAGEVAVDVDVANRLVTVAVTRAQQTFIAGVFATDTVEIFARGNAEASSAATGSNCAKPFFVPNTVLASEEPCDACDSGAELLISGGVATSFAASQTGQQFSIKPQNPQQAIGPGQFYAIQIGGQGASTYRDNIESCAPLAVYCQQSYSVETGNMVGPTQQGVQGLIGPDPDLYLQPGQYERADGTVGDTSRSLIVAPVADLCTTPDFNCPQNKLRPGTNVALPVVGFALIFVEGVQGDDVVARLIGVTACSAFGGPDPPPPGPFAVPVRLVTVPEGQ